MRMMSFPHLHHPPRSHALWRICARFGDRGRVRPARVPMPKATPARAGRSDGWLVHCGLDRIAKARSILVASTGFHESERFFLPKSSGPGLLIFHGLVALASFDFVLKSLRPVRTQSWSCQVSGFALACKQHQSVPHSRLAIFTTIRASKGKI